jgi:hypothetical protein
MLSSARRQMTAPFKSLGRAGSCSRCHGDSLKAGVGPQLPRPAHGPQTQSGQSAGGALRSMLRCSCKSRQCVVAQWRSGSFGPLDLPVGRGCPELVKPIVPPILILQTDICICMLQHVSCNNWICIYCLKSVCVMLSLLVCCIICPGILLPSSSC